MYRYLAGRLKQLGIDRATLSKMLDMSMPALSQRFNSHVEWRACEMYEVLQIIGATPEEMHIYFPKGGMSI